METLAGKVAVITGGSAGIGAATAKLFAKYGCSLLITGRKMERLQKVVDECRQLGLKKNQIVPLQVTEIEEEGSVNRVAAAAMDKFSKINILVNNGANADGSLKFPDSPVEVLDNMYRMHVRSPYLLTKLLLPQLIENKGSVVNIASGGGIVPFMMMDYCVMKAALIHMTTCMAVTLVLTRTNVFDNHKLTDAKDPWDEFGKLAPSGRCAEPEEVAQLVAFLASDAAPYINGENIVIDGATIRTMGVVAKLETP